MEPARQLVTTTSLTPVGHLLQENVREVLLQMITIEGEGKNG